MALLGWLQELNAEITRHAWADMPSVVARVLLSGASRLLFVLNTTAQSAAVTVTLPGVQRKPDVRDLIDGGQVHCGLADGELTFQEDLGPYGTKVYLLE